MLKKHALLYKPCIISTMPRKIIPGCFNSKAVMRCIRSFSASSNKTIFYDNLLYLAPTAMYRKYIIFHKILFYFARHQYGSYYTITLWFPCLDGLIQTRGKVARVEKCARNTSRRRVIFRTFLNSNKTIT